MRGSHERCSANAVRRLSGLIGLTLALALGTAGTAAAAPFSLSSQDSIDAGPLVTADFDGDADLDLATMSSGTVKVLLGAGDGNFADPVAYDAGADAGALAVIHADDGGDPDLVVSRSGEAGSVALMLGGAGGTFAAPVKLADLPHAGRMHVADFNQDGDSDLLVMAHAGWVLTGGSGAAFAAPTRVPIWGSAIATADFNGDSALDVVTALNGSGDMYVFQGSTGATFATGTEIASDTYYADSIATGDFDGDADPDLAVAVPYLASEGVSIFRGTADSSFAAPSLTDVGDGPELVAASDFTGDGEPDLAVSTTADARIYAGGTGTSFTHAGDVGGGGSAVSMVTGDFNGDSVRDLAFGHYSSVRVYLGQRPAAPTALASSPVSPGKDTTPQITGTADAGATVRLYASADCSGAPVATGTSAEFADPGLTVTVASGSNTTFRATAGNGVQTSPCSTSSVAYQEASPTLNLTADSHPAPGQPIPYTASGAASVTSKVFFVATTPASTCASNADAQYSLGGGQGTSPEHAPGPYTFTQNAAPGSTRICAYLYERETSGVWAGYYDLSGVPDAAATVVASSGAALPPADADGDGTPDQGDACPNVPGPAAGPSNTAGCPPVVQEQQPACCEAPAGGFTTFTQPAPFVPPPGFDEGEEFNEGESHSFEIAYFIAPRGKIAKFVKTGSLGSLVCSICRITSTVKLPAAVARKLRLKSATIGKLSLEETGGSTPIKFRLTRTVKAKLAKLTKVVLTLQTTVFHTNGTKDVLGAKKVTLTK